MILNVIIAGIVGCLLLVLYAINRILNFVNILDESVRTIGKVNELLHDRLLYVEKLVNNKVENEKEYD